MTARRTKIVCTLGPASASAERIEALIRAGMDVARINFSHGTQAEHAITIARVRAAAARLDRPIAILQDLQGPKIRTGALEHGGSVTLPDGQSFTITTRLIAGGAAAVSTTYDALPRDVAPGDRILLADGAIELRVERVAGDNVTCRVVHGGRLAEHQGINLPGVAVSAPALTEKDRADLAFGVAQRVDYVALSFVRTPDDLRKARKLTDQLLRAAPEPDGPRPEGLHPSAYAAERTLPIIAKIEKPEALNHLDAILELANGAMVARGDLGVEMPLERVPVAQKRIIARANALGIPVITATQMLESMVDSPRPTRAEASDVANAVWDMSDALMLSEETAVGRYPVESVAMMDRIIRRAEAATAEFDREVMTAPENDDHSYVVALAARRIVESDANMKAVVCFTQSGYTALLMSKVHPNAPIFAVSPH